jgi:hypothetical protein
MIATETLLLYDLTDIALQEFCSLPPRLCPTCVTEKKKLSGTE